MRAFIDEGRVSEIVSEDARAPVARFLERNINGIGRTDIQLDEEPPILILPQSARIASLALERKLLEVEANKRDWQRTEYGSFEGEITGLTRWNGKPALEIVDRISGISVTCVLSPALSSSLGAQMA